MIQRIQSLYMLAGAVAILMLFLFPLASYSVPEATFQFTAFGLTSLTPEVPLDEMGWAILLALVVMFALPLVTLFLYRNLELQTRLLIYTAVLDLLFYGLFFWQSAQYESFLGGLFSAPADVVFRLVVFVMPALSFLCMIMAVRYVRRDKWLLEAADRLRPLRRR